MDIEGFKQKMSASHQEFEILNSSDSEYTHFRFIGNFESKPVIWDAHLYTLAYYVDEIARFSQADVPIRQFIEVADLNELGRKIEIGLNLPKIDETTILKSMIMIRQYKRLSRGRHEYGEKISVTD